jgi:hypothetical protein
MAAVQADVFEPAFSEMPPGPELALLLGAQECDRLDDFDVVEMARAARRLASWAASLELGAIAELAARRRRQGVKLGAWDSEVGEWVADEVAAALTLSGGTAAHLVVMAEQLAESLPLTFRALREGLIDVAKARVIADGLRPVRPEVAAEVERQVLPSAPGQTCAQLRSAVRKAVQDVDPEGCAERRRLAEEARCLELWDNGEGTSDLSGRNLPAGAASAAWNRVNAIAAALKADGDPRTIEQLRADVFIALLRNERPEPVHDPSTDSASPPTSESTTSESTTSESTGSESTDSASSTVSPAAAGSPRDIDDVAAQAQRAAGTAGGTPAGADGAPTAGPGESDPRTAAFHSGGAFARVEDGPAIAAAVADAVREQLARVAGGRTREQRQRLGQAAVVSEAVRRIKAATAELNARWCVTTPHGRAVRHGADSYRAPAAMRRWLDARDVTCRYPGCRRPAARCDADHTEPHHKGGVTCPCNLSNLCRRHHRLKQRPEWILIQVWHGVLVWIAPTGHWYVVEPNDR